MPETQEYDVHHGFTDADAASSAAPMVAFLEQVEAIPEFADYKAALRRGLELQPGDAVVDVGCGIGMQASRIAADHNGPVIGVDREAMLTQAREHASSSNSVRWLEGDAQDLPLDDSSVDACVVERVLKYQSRPNLPLAEMARVLRPGGSVGAFELDYASLTLGGDQRIADEVHAMLCDSVAEPRMGRRLPELLSDAGFTDITTRAVAFVAPWPVHDMIVRTPVRRAIDDGRLEAEPTRAWLADQEHPGALTSIHVGVLAGARQPGAQ